MLYEEFEAKIQSISNDILNDHFVPDVIIAIARGGWIPARILSKYLGVKKLSSFGLSYVDDTRNALITYDSPFPALHEQKILLVEDFLESGQSMMKCTEDLRKLKNRVKTFAVGYHIKSQVIPDYTSGAMHEIPQLPWD